MFVIKTKDGNYAIACLCGGVETSSANPGGFETYEDAKDELTGILDSITAERAKELELRIVKIAAKRRTVSISILHNAATLGAAGRKHCPITMPSYEVEQFPLEEKQLEILETLFRHLNRGNYGLIDELGMAVPSLSVGDTVFLHFIEIEGGFNGRVVRDEKVRWTCDIIGWEQS